MKLLVTVLLVADTANTIFDFCWIYDALINHFDDPPALHVADWMFATDPVMVGTISTIVQLFFAWRVQVLTAWPLVTAAIIVTALTSFMGAVGTTIAVTLYPQFMHFHKFQVIVILWLASSVACDILITLAISWYLKYTQAGFHHSDHIGNKVIRMTVKNGLITSVCATVDLIAFVTSTTGLHLAFNFPLSKLYTNILMASLHSRRGWKYGSDETGGARVEALFTSQVVVGRDALPASLPATDIDDYGYELRSVASKTSHDLETGTRQNLPPDIKAIPLPRVELTQSSDV